MADVRSKLLLEINASVGEANKALDSVNKKLGRLKKTQDEFSVSSDRAGLSFTKTGFAIAAGGTAAIIAAQAIGALTGQLKSLLSSSISTALTFERLTATLPALARNTGRTREEILRIVNAIREEDKSIVEAIEITKGIIIAQLNETDALKLVATARDIGAVAGTNSARVNKLILESVQTLNPGLLKMVGINVSLQVVFREAAEALGKQRAELTTTERQQALFNAIIQEGEKFQGAYNLAMTTAQKILGSVRDSFREVQLAIGFVLTRALQPILQQTLEANRAFRAWAITTEGELNPAIISLGQKIGTFVLASFQLTIELTKELIKFIRDLNSEIQDMTGGMGVFGTALGALAVIFFGVIDAVRLFRNELQNFFLSAFLGFPRLKKVAIDAILGVINVVNKAAGVLGKLGIGSGKVFRGITADLEAMRQSTEFDIGVMQGLFRETDSTLENFMDKFDEAKKTVQKATFGITSAWENAKGILGDFSSAISDTTDIMGGLNKETDAGKSILSSIISLWKEFVDVIEEFDITSQEGFEGFVAFLRDTETDIDTFADTFRKNFANITAAFDETVDAQKNKLKELERAHENTQDAITALITQNVERQKDIQLSAQDDIIRAVLKADQDVAALRTKIEEQRLDGIERVANEQARLDESVATERGRIAILRGRIEETIGKKKNELLQTLADREQALINFAATGAEKIIELRDQELSQIEEIEQELIKRQTVLERVATLEQGVIDRINTAREDAKLNEIDRILLIATRKQVAQEQEFAAETKRLNNKLASLATEQAAVTTQLANIQQQRQIVEQFITNLLKENLAKRRKELDADFNHQFALIDRATTKWQQYLAVVRSAIAVASRTAIGAPTLAAPATAKGGIVTSPQIRLVGEAGPEAIIPLKRGGGGFGNITINVTGNTILGADKEKLALEIGDAIFRRVNLNIRTG